jgi:N-formylglutamate amidohydrolase
MRTLAMAGIEVALNHPYAGGYVLERHGRPQRGIHALQVEIDRSLYLDTELRLPGHGMAAMRSVLGELVRTLAEDMLRPPGTAEMAIAAE